MTKRIVVISDTQIPFEDRKALDAVVRFIGEYQPDELVHIGDLMDYPTPSQWSKGMAEEWASNEVFEQSEDAKRRFLGPLRELYSGPFKVFEGNHDERPRKYLARYAPAVAGTDAVNFETLLDFKAFDIEKLSDFYRFAPGWAMTHGHKAKFNISQIGGSTALNGAKKAGVSIIMGHTHRLGVHSISRGLGGNVDETLTGMEVGNLMNQKMAGYLNGGTANWQQGFGIVHVDGTHVTPIPVPIAKKKFVVDGVSYSV